MQLRAIVANIGANYLKWKFHTSSAILHDIKGKGLDVYIIYNMKNKLQYKYKDDKSEGKAVQEFIIPYNLDMPSLVSISIRRLTSVNESIFLEKMTLFLDLICRKSFVTRSEKNRFWVQISSKTSQKLLGTRYDSKIKTALEESGVIEINRSYMAGNFSMRYRITKEYRRHGVQKLRHRSKFNPQGHAPDLSYYLSNRSILIRNTVINLLKLTPPRFETLDTSSMNEWAQDCLQFQIVQLSSKHIFCSRDICGRLHSNFTNLQRNARSLSTLNGKPLFQADVKSCFATLLYSQIESRDERGRYISWLYQDDFYRELMSRDSRLKNRDSVKLQFNAWLNGESRCVAIRKIIATEFPILYSKIIQMQSKDRATLGRKLMSMESSIMIDGVLKKLWEADSNMSILSLHDAIYFTEECGQSVREKIENEFRARLGISARITIESCSEERFTKKFFE